jgi:cellobiose phosphorylase
MPAHKICPNTYASKYGHFSDDGLEYVLTRPDTPRPWCNILANGDYGCIVSQAGGGFSWRGNSQLNMLNRWEQDLLRDEFGRFLYLRDADSGSIWSADWQPMQLTSDEWAVRHGLGYTVTDLTANGIRCEKTVFVPKDAPCEVWSVTLTNQSNRDRTIGLFTYLEWQLASIADWHREFHKTFMATEWIPGINTLYAWKKGDVEQPEDPFAAFFGVASQPAEGYDADKESFLGRYGTTRLPAGVAAGKLARRTGRWNDSIAALHAEAVIPAGESRTVVFVVGAGSREEARACVAPRRWTT